MLKLDPKNTQLLAQKQAILRENIAQTTEKLKQLKIAQDLYIKSGGNLNSSEYRNIQREIINTESKLKQLKLEASNWTRVSKALDDVSKKMKNVGDSVSNIGKKASVASSAVAGLFGAGVKYNADIETSTKAFETFLDSSEEASKAIDAIKKQSATSPFETSELIKANQYLITTGESADDSRKTISALADAIALTGGGNDELNRMASNLQQIKNAGKATSMDIKQFAYAGIDVYGILSETTGKNVEELKKMDITYEDLSEALIKASEDGGKYYNGQAQMAETLNGQISKLKKTFQELLGELSESLMPIIKKVTERLQGFIDWFKSLDQSQKDFITKIGLIIVAIGPILIIIGKIISFGGMLVSVISKISAVIGSLSAGTGALSGVLAALTGPIGIVIAVIATLTGVFVYLYKTNEEFRKKVKEIWDDIVTIFKENVMPIFEELKNLVITVVGNVISYFKILWEYLKPLFEQMLTWLMDFWNNTLKGIVKNVLDFIKNLVQLAQVLWKNFINPIVTWLVNVFGKVFSTVFSKVWKIVSGVITNIGTVIKALIGYFAGIIEFITGVFSGDWEKAWNGVKKAFGSIFGGIKELASKPINWIIDKINNFLKGLNNIQIPDWVPGAGGKGFSIPLIPKLAKGGIVDSATLAMIGEGRSPEAVIPLDRTLTNYLSEAMKQVDNNRSIVVNFYPQQMTEAEMDKAFNYINRKFGVQY